MARIINVIHQPHLVTYKGFETSNYRCCGVCEYKVFLENDDGRLLVASAMDDDYLRYLDIEEAVTKLSDKTQNKDYFYSFDRVVYLKDIDNFINGQLETDGDDVFCITRNVLEKLRESNSTLSNECVDALRKLADEIDKTVRFAQ